VPRVDAAAVEAARTGAPDPGGGRAVPALAFPSSAGPARAAMSRGPGGLREPAGSRARVRGPLRTQPLTIDEIQASVSSATSRGLK
jgi:hypothetical protein